MRLKLRLRRMLRRSPLAQAWRGYSTARRDMIVIVVVTVLVWLAIERTETCDRIFDWIADHEDYEVDSIILALILASTGITVAACRRFLEMQRASEARDAAELRVQHLAYRDPLTGLENRRALAERLDMAEARGEKDRVGLIYIDLDRFKAVNDMHGHLAGDRLLRMVSERLLNELKPEQVLYRLGGDEFAIVAKLGSNSDEAPLYAAGRIVAAASKPFDDSGLIHHIGASAGIAYFPGDADNSDALARAADVALYFAKQAGRGRSLRYEATMDDAARERAQLEQELRLAIRRHEFRPAYQPLHDFATGKVSGYEMLARWHRPDGKDVGPDLFIPVAEEYGLIGELSFNLLNLVCEETRDWDPALTIAINISPVQLKDPLLAQKVLAALTRHGFPPQRLSIEITENALIGDEANARRTVMSLRNQGMHVALDDFGTGYSSLHHLRILPFDRIKIDKSFVRNLVSDLEAQKIVRAIHGLASSLGLDIIAEGIESSVVASVARELGCTFGQGDYFGKASSAAAIESNEQVMAAVA